MSSMSFWTMMPLMSARLSAAALARRMGWPIRATFRMDMSNELYWAGPTLHPHGPAAPSRRIARVSLLPTLRQRARTPAAEADRAGAARVHDVHVRVLHRPEDRGRHDHPRGIGPARARP